MASGRMAGETIVEAKKRGDFSARTLRLYREKLEASFLMKDLKDHKDVESELRKNRALLTTYPRLLNEVMHEYFLVDGRPKREHKRRILELVRRDRGYLKMVKDAWVMRKMVGE